MVKTNSSNSLRFLCVGMEVICAVVKVEFRMFQIRPSPKKKEIGTYVAAYSELVYTTNTVSYELVVM